MEPEEAEKFFQAMEDSSRLGTFKIPKVKKHPAEDEEDEEALKKDDDNPGKGSRMAYKRIRTMGNEDESEDENDKVEEVEEEDKKKENLQSIKEDPAATNTEGRRSCASDFLTVVDNSPPKGQDDHPGNSLNHLSSQLQQQQQDEKYCRLCNIHLTSSVVARDHYRGKSHAKMYRKVAAVEEEVVPRTLQQQPMQQPPKTNAATSYSSSSSEIYHFFCMPCQTECHSKEEIEQHVSSLAHKTKSAEDEHSCRTCGVPCADRASLDAHQCRDQSRSKEGEVAAIVSVAAAGPTVAHGSSSGNDFPKCKVCQVEVCGEANMQSHLNGKQHKRKELMQKLGESPRPPPPPPPEKRKSGGVMGSFSCLLCQVETTDRVGLEMHLKGKKHRKKLELMK